MGTIAIIALIVIIIGSSICTINQGTIGVTTIFGKYNRMLSAGLNFKIPLIEQIFKRVSIQK